MIRFADKETEAAVRDMWRECFGDTEEFMEMYFSRKYRNQNTLIYFHGGRPAASLQMHPYRMTFYGHEVMLCYLSGICTLPRFRGHGFASALIREAHRESARRGALLTVLIPASEGLYGYYGRFGYEKVFDASDSPIPLDKILDSSADLKGAYRRFDAMYRGVDFCVQKTFDDFAMIAADYEGDGRPVKTDLDGVACLIDHKPLLEIYARNNPSLSFTLRIHDTEGEGLAVEGRQEWTHGAPEVAGGPTEAFFRIEAGKVAAFEGGSAEDIVTSAGDHAAKEIVTADRRLLARLLMGYKTGSLAEPYRSLFPEHHPIMNLMLE